MTYLFILFHAGISGLRELRQLPRGDGTLNMKCIGWRNTSRHARSHGYWRLGQSCNIPHRWHFWRRFSYTKCVISMSFMNLHADYKQSTLYPSGLRYHEVFRFGLQLGPPINSNENQLTNPSNPSINSRNCHSSIIWYAHFIAWRKAIKVIANEINQCMVCITMAKHFFKSLISVHSFVALQYIV